MLKPSPKLCIEHDKSNSSCYPDPNMFPYSLTSVPYVPFIKLFSYLTHHSDPLTAEIHHDVMVNLARRQIHFGTQKSL